MDLSVTKIDLPCPVRAAASDGTTVWCAGTDGVHAYTTSGTPLPRSVAGDESRSRTPELRCLAAVPGTVTGTAGVPGTLPETVMVPRTFAGTPASEGSLQGTLVGTAAGRVYWLDPDGTPQASARFDGRVRAGGGEIWAVAGDQARRLTGPGRLAEPVELPGLDMCAVEGERLWWTSTRDTLLRGGPREIDLGRRERGAMTVCAGSLWISVRDGLLRVSAWSGEPRRLVAAPDGPVPFLVCANGVLAGGGRDLFALAPAAGAALRVVKLGLWPPLALMIAAGKHVWAFPAGRAQALIVPVS
ncbi:hypothetical protein ETD86_19445 [Nonomuraea turkmeniaca]|uniref:SMP-30/gluconolactonase/LRE family protein n=1 Tax=Nonomuraea turkmeniaca TaxID=103838 RepID=A0A5S4FI42_9ACTN|nr:hypothetical protein [Nonomuraea turkmeniaca]TMR19922.1 hypothetical protein ETD86_19445 [Nonomuraea turkmeniaca]